MKIVILLHGYGHNGTEFLESARPFLGGAPDVVLLAPDAPLSNGADYRYWFELDKMTYYELRNGLEQAAPFLLSYIDEAKRKHGSDDVNLVGFSQGAIMAFEMLYHTKISKIVAYSGLFAPPAKKAVTSTETDILIVHSEDDAVVPFSNVGLAKKSLDDLGISARIITYEDIGHSISADAWSRGFNFLK